MTPVNDDQLTRAMTEASRLVNTGRSREARALLEPIYARAADAPDPYRASVVAHFMAHAQDGLPARLRWHLLALRAAEAAEPERVLAFLPSLHANVADTYMRLGDIAAARRHIASAREAEHVLQRDAYDETVRSLIARLAEQAEAQDLPET